MYSTCIFCHRPLGSNESVESFPVGRRLAFDAARGRMWVVCGGCGRWNLSPLEERWEAIEECERAYRATRLRVSTDNVGLARLREGTDLIRVGAPQRPEFAAWRYGGELMRRMRGDLSGAFWVAGSAVGAMIGSIAAFPVLGLGGVVAAPFLYAGGAVAVVRAQDRRVVARERDAAGTEHRVRVGHLRTVRFLPGEDGLALATGSDAGTAELTGAAAARVASVTCARRNAIGGTHRQVQAAVDFVERAGGPDEVLAHAARVGAFGELRHTERLALEMALHEEGERRALAGELEALEDAWRQAEEIAAIADTLLVPESVERALRRLGRGDGEPT